MRAKAERCGKPVRILSCYEAGLDGHWLHRWLTAQGVISHVVDPSSIEVSRRARRAKTDRIDLEKLMRVFLAYLRGEPRVCSMLHVPSVEDEDRKRRNRERERLLKERTAHTNRIKALLFGQGIRDVHAAQAGLHRQPRELAHRRRTAAAAAAQGGDRARARAAVSGAASRSRRWRPRARPSCARRRPARQRPRSCNSSISRASA